MSVTLRRQAVESLNHCFISQISVTVDVASVTMLITASQCHSVSCLSLSCLSSKKSSAVFSTERLFFTHDGVVRPIPIQVLLSLDIRSTSERIPVDFRIPPRR